MARQRKEKEAKLKLSQPDRSGPDPTQETLFSIAEKRGLAKAQRDRQAELDAAKGTNNDNGDPLIGRLGDAILWSISLTMLHFTLDVLVSNQYAVDIKWDKIAIRTGQFLPGISLYSPFLFLPV